MKRVSDAAPAAMEANPSLDGDGGDPAAPPREGTEYLS